MKQKTLSFFKRLAAAAADRASLVVFAAGLVLFAGGLWLAWPPLGLIGPGAVLMAISLFGGQAATGAPGAGGGDDLSE